MKKISELDTEEVHSTTDIRNKLNEVIQVVNNLRCVDVDTPLPVLESLAEGECFLISMSEDGLLVACNQKGEVRLEKVKEKSECEIKEIEVGVGDNIGDVIKKAWGMHIKDYRPITFRFNDSMITILYDGTERLTTYKGGDEKTR